MDSQAQSSRACHDLGHGASRADGGVSGVDAVSGVDTVRVRITTEAFPLNDWGTGLGRTVSTYGQVDAWAHLHVPHDPRELQPTTGDFVCCHVSPVYNTAYYARIV